jgi:hypothetical protein
MPKPLLHPLSWIIAIAVYWPLARLSRTIECLGQAGTAEQVPLSHYRNLSLSFMAGDAFDRFATPIEKRYSRAAIADWHARYGREARFSERAPFWVSLATRPSDRAHA